MTNCVPVFPNFTSNVMREGITPECEFEKFVFSDRFSENCEIVSGCFVILASIIGVCLNCYINKCDNCGDWGVGTGHLVSCELGHNYYYCFPGSAWVHGTCY